VKFVSKFRNGLSYFGFKRLVSGAFNTEFDRVNLHCPTVARASSARFTHSGEYGPTEIPKNVIAWHIMTREFELCLTQP
jgi:hypothetical protein